MKKIAIITSGFAPVPAVDNGAVEMLTTYLIEDNEIYKQCHFDIFTISDKRLNSFHYQYSNIIQIKVNKLESIAEKTINKVLRFLNKKVISIYNYKLIKRMKKKYVLYDVIIFENLMNVFQSIKNIYKEADINYILHLHNDLNPISKSENMAKDMADSKTTIITVSNYIRNRFIASSKCNPLQCKVLYNCIDLKRYVRNSNMPEEPGYQLRYLKQKLGFQQDDFVLLYVGRLNQEKGIDKLAMSFAQIRTSKIKLVICGGTWGSEFRGNRFLKQIYTALGKNKRNVVFTGYIPTNKIRSYYDIADVVVIPSVVQEAFGMVMLEAAALGKPIIATKSGGMVEILSNKEAYFIDGNEFLVQQLTEQILYCFNNQSKIIEVGELARKRILLEDRFDRTKYYKRFLEKIETGYPLCKE